jgi:hypothetical protein
MRTAVKGCWLKVTKGLFVVGEGETKSHMMAVGYANVGQMHRPTVGLKDTLVRTTVPLQSVCMSYCGPTLAVTAVCICTAVTSLFIPSLSSRRLHLDLHPIIGLVHIALSLPAAA